MAESTGPILAIGAITMANRSIFHDEPVDWKIPVATAIAAGMFSLMEQAVGEWAVRVAWIALVSSLLTRLEPTVPSPAESALAWWNAGPGK